jgi:hypothetical protein
MKRVSAIAERPIDPSLFAVVVIGEPEENQRHIGILHRTEKSEPTLLHLAWHCQLHDDEELPDYMTLWAAPNIKPKRLRSFAALCRRVWRKNAKGGVPYAFSSPGNAFDPTTGAFLVGPTCYGLTCATFVLALFHTAGLRLANYHTWTQDRQGDREWQESIVKSLEGRTTDEHIQHIRAETGAARFRPEEVAASVALMPPAVNFNSASALGQKIVEKLHECSDGDAPPP